MTATVVGIQRLFEYMGNLGQWIRQHLVQSSKVEVKGNADVKVVLDLGPQLEGVIRDILHADKKQETPVAFWARATHELIRHDEQKFRELHRLGVSDMTLGTEAISQQSDAVPEDIKRVTVQYVERYVLADTHDEASDWALPDSFVADALETVIRNATKEGAAPLTERPGELKIRPRWGG